MTIAKAQPVKFSGDKVNEVLADQTIDNINVAVMYTDELDRIIYINKKFEEITGLKFKDVHNKTPEYLATKTKELAFYGKMKEFVHKNDSWQGEYFERNRNSIYVQTVTISKRRKVSGEQQQYIVIFSEFTDHDIAALNNGSMNMYYDSLTSLPNRFLFEKRIISYINQLQHSDQPFAVVFFRLDHFSEINEEYGLLFGDVILQRIAARLSQQTANHFMVTRWNGTEFACIIENISGKQDIDVKIENIYTQITMPIAINGIEVSLGAKFGVHIYTDRNEEVTDFLSKAHTALVAAKTKNADVQFYDESMGQNEKLFIMELELKRAIEEDHFEVYYQPLISCETKELIGFEGLVRWIHPTEGIISPIKFISLAEQTGMIREIGDIVFEKACIQIGKWCAKGYDDIKIHVNISMIQFKNDNFVSNIKDILDKTNVSPKNIGIELTESSVSVNMEDTINKLKQLKDLGLSIAIDDFGTGYSSFGYLIDFPVERIKIDRSYIKVLESNQKIAAIVNAISQMGNTLDVEVVAEGIETDEQFARVQSLNCKAVQGFLFDQYIPGPEAEEKWLRKKIMQS